MSLSKLFSWFSGASTDTSQSKHIFRGLSIEQVLAMDDLHPHCSDFENSELIDMYFFSHSTIELPLKT